MIDMERIKQIVMSSFFMAVAGCATLPPGPGVSVMPPPGKPFSQFQAEDANCRMWAEKSTGITPAEAQNQNAAVGAGVGSVLGAGAGALLGSASGHMGAGAAIGAGAGLLMGSAAGSDSGRMTGREAQRRYDNAYVQCMTSSGNQVINQNVERVPYYSRRRVIVLPAESPPVYYVPAPPPTYQTAPVYPPPGTPPPPPLYAPPGGM